MIEGKPPPTREEIAKAAAHDRPAWRLAWRSDASLRASYGTEDAFLEACERAQRVRLLQGTRWTR